jgi:hypothetical protein
LAIIKRFGDEILIRLKRIMLMYDINEILDKISVGISNLTTSEKKFR